MSTPPKARVRVALTIGDVNGIGPEVALKTVQVLSGSEAIEPVLVGPEPLWRNALDQARSGRGGTDPTDELDWGDVVEDAEIEDVAMEPADSSLPRPGAISAEAGRVAMRAVERAVDLCAEGTVSAMVTAPISKEGVRAAGWEIPGHTEFIADRVGTSGYAMMMTAEELRVALLTTHVPLRAVAELLDRTLIEEKLDVVVRALRTDFGIADPSIAVLGLNPHAGDGGVIGTEEESLIRPLLAERIETGHSVDGPFAADAFFARQRYEPFDAILAPYHDQGLIPFKMLAAGKGVNVTVGLPIVRTSPDHGTAFDIAGTGRADPSSMVAAARLAGTIARRRLAQVSATDE